MFILSKKKLYAVQISKTKVDVRGKSRLSGWGIRLDR